MPNERNKRNKIKSCQPAYLHACLPACSPMHNVVFVAVCDGVYNAADAVSGLVLRVVLLADDAVKELSSRAKLHHHVKVL